MSEVERRQLIVGLLRERPFASVRELQDHLGVSPATVRRDIERIDAGGQARKVHGGVAALEARAPAALAPSYAENSDIAVDTKRRIAELAATMVRDGDTVIVHGGSTCFHLGAALAARPIRLYTNSMPLAAYLGEHGTLSLSVAGGQLHREPGILHDPGQTPPFFASQFFVGAQGIGPEGLLESHPLLVTAMTELARWADRIVVLADSRKFRIRARSAAVPLSRVATVVTDDGLADHDRRMLEDEGVAVRVVPRSAGAVA